MLIILKIGAKPWLAMSSNFDDLILITCFNLQFSSSIIVADVEHDNFWQHAVKSMNFVTFCMQKGTGLKEFKHTFALFYLNLFAHIVKLEIDMFKSVSLVVVSF